MALNRRQTRQRLYNIGIDLGFARTADAIVAQGITDAFFDDESQGEGRYTGRVIYRPDEDEDNDTRIASIVDGDTLTHEGEAYDDDGSELYYEVIGLYPTEINECIRLALRTVYYETYMPVTPWVDGDFAAGSLTTPYNWTTSAVNTTPTLSTTGGVVTQAGQSGKTNLVLTNSSANGYMPTSNLYVNPGDKVFSGAIGRVNGDYTASVILYDVTQSAALWTLTSTSRAFVRMMREYTIPEGCNEVELRFGGVDSDAVTEWDCLPGHLIGEEGSSIVVPSSISEQWRFLGLGPAEYGRDVESYVKNASSRRFVRWIRGDDFELFPLQEEANPYTVQLFNDGGAPANSELWMHVMRPYSDVEDLVDDESGTTNCPEDLFMAAVKFQLFDLLHGKDKDVNGNSEWLAMREEARMRLDAQRKARPVSKPKPKQYHMQVSV